MPRVLSDADVADFRERLCEAAERLFAEKGLEAVTMRQLAAELGVSPMTPYRYFKDKDDILAAVRTGGFNRFAEALEAAYERDGSARDKAVAVGAAYLDFAFASPQTYKLMFDLNQPNEQDYPQLVEAAERARRTMSQYVKPGLGEGASAEEIGLMMWAAVHGAVGLELAGKLKPGAGRALAGRITATLAAGLRAGAPA